MEFQNESLNYTSGVLYDAKREKKGGCARFAEEEKTVTGILFTEVGVIQFTTYVPVSLNIILK